MTTRIPASFGVDLAALAGALNDAETTLNAIEPTLDRENARQLRERIGRARRTLAFLGRWRGAADASENAPLWRHLSSITFDRRATDHDRRSGG